MVSKDIINNLIKVKMFEGGSSKENDIYNSYLLDLHKLLLNKVNLLPENYEAGILWDLYNNKYYLLKGTDSHVDFKSNKNIFNISRTPIERSLVFMHNHPHDSRFSNADVTSFILNRAIYAITAVCHCGDIYMLRKDSVDSLIMLQNVYDLFIRKSKLGCSVCEDGIRLFSSIEKTIRENSNSLSVTYRVSRR